MPRVRRRGPKKIQFYSAKRRAIMAAGEQIDHLTVFERDEWTCGICKEPVDKNLRQPDPKCATVDHIVPISVCIVQGWAVETIHTYANVQLAHLDCNLDKSNQAHAKYVMIEVEEKG